MWRSIKTAPKDEAVLVYHHGVKIAHWNSARQGWVGYGWDTADTLNMLREPPTHWMPLPDPPHGEKRQ